MFWRPFKRKPRLRWHCTRCGAKCVSVYDLVCGKPDELIAVPTEDNSSASGMRIEWHTPACPLEEI